MNCFREVPGGPIPRRDFLRDTTARLTGPALGASALGWGCSEGAAPTEPPDDGEASVPRNLTASTPLARLDFRRSYVPGTEDAAGAFLGGTELMWLAGHEGVLYAANGYGQDVPGSDPSPGPQVLRKDGPDAPWRVDVGFGTHFLRTEFLGSLELTTDGAGRPLSPQRLLVASPSPLSAVAGGNSVFVRSGAGSWQQSVIAAGTLGVRSLGSHVDRVTGVHHVFAGLNDGRVHRGVFDPAAPGSLRWTSVAERPATTERSRVMSFAECDGVLYMTARIDDDGAGRPTDGGLYRRVDGPDPRWQLVHTWPVDPGVPQSRFLRGLTAVPDPSGGGGEVLVANREYPGLMVRYDPRRAVGSGLEAPETEVDLKVLFDLAFGPPPGGRRGIIAAYNRLVPVLDPASGSMVWMCGAWAEHPRSPSPPFNGSVYLIRHRDARYEWGYVYDPTSPVAPGSRLTGTRDIEPSPFSEERGRAFYFGGYDGGAGPSHNTAWIYRGSLPR